MPQPRTPDVSRRSLRPSARPMSGAPSLSIHPYGRSHSFAPSFPERLSKRIFSDVCPEVCRSRRRREAQGIDDEFLRACKLFSFNPSQLKPTNLDLLCRLGRIFGPGITVSEFRKIIRRCVICQNFVYTDRRSRHRCNGTVLQTQHERFDLVGTLLATSENAGLSTSDFERLLARCNACTRICLESATDLHECPALP